MAYNVQLAGTPSYTDFPFFNFTVTDIPAGAAVKLDATNFMGAANPSLEGIGIAVTNTDGDVVIGYTIDVIRAGQSGRVRCGGPISLTVADGAIAVGATVMASGTSGKNGRVKTRTTGLAPAGTALTAAADGESLLVLGRTGAAT